MKDPIHLLQDQHGAATRGQLRVAGLSDLRVRRRIESGDWLDEGFGLIRVAAAPTSAMQDLWIGWLSAGPSAVVSHRSAAWLWDLCGPPKRHDVIIARSNQARHARPMVHRPRSYPDHVVPRKGLPCTDPLRTVVDLATLLPPTDLHEAIDRGVAGGLITHEGVAAERRRRLRKGRSGGRKLDRTLRERGATGRPGASALEQRALRLFRSGGLEPLSVEVRHGEAGRYRVDFQMSTRVVAEVDGWAYHSSPSQKSQDERRRNELRLAGLVVLVYTWRDIAHDGGRVLREIRMALATF